MKYFLTGLFITIFLSYGFSQTLLADLSLRDAISQKDVALSKFKSKKVLVVIFAGNFCPYSKLYNERINALYQGFSDKEVQFLLINPNTQTGNPDETEAITKERAGVFSASLPYLIDADYKAVNAFKASKTPECFVLIPQGNQWKVVYSGAIDDNPQVSGDVSQHYLKSAIEASLMGKNPGIKHMRPTGCMIKK